MKGRHWLWVHYLVSLLIISLGLCACAPSMKVPVTRPAEINFRGIQKIAIGEITGNSGAAIYDELSAKLFSGGYFQLVERTQLDKIMREQKLSNSGAIDEKSAIQVGKLVGAAALIYGNSQAKYDIKNSSSKWQDKAGRIHVTYEKEGKLAMNTTLRVVGLETGKILAIKNIPVTKSHSTRADDEYPVDPDKDAMFTDAAQETTDVFVKVIQPYKDVVTINFAETDSKVPELEAGINFCRLGRWPDAIAQFKQATVRNPVHAGAWYDLGLAYEYSYMFKEAEAAFIEAMKIEPNGDATREIANVRALAAERKKLEEQGGLNLQSL